MEVKHAILTNSFKELHANILKKTKAVHYLMDDIVLIYFAIMMIEDWSENLAMVLLRLGMAK